MGRSKSDVWVGLFVIIGLVAIVFLALRAANLLQLNWGATYPITAYFDNVGGLKSQAAVRSAGVVVGRVESIRFDDQRFQALVTLNMDKRYKFPDDSSLKILTSGLLGEQYISVSAGPSDKDWTAGAKVTDTQSAIVLEDLISRFLFNSAASGAKDGQGSGAGSQ